MTKPAFHSKRGFKWRRLGNLSNNDVNSGLAGLRLCEAAKISTKIGVASGSHNKSAGAG